MIAGRPRRVTFASYLSSIRRASGGGTIGTIQVGEVAGGPRPRTVSPRPRWKGGDSHCVSRITSATASRAASAFPRASIRSIPTGLVEAQPPGWPSIRTLDNGRSRRSSGRPGRHAQRAREAARPTGDQHGGRQLRAARGKCADHRGRCDFLDTTFWGGIRGCVKAAGVSRSSSSAWRGTLR